MFRCPFVDQLVNFLSADISQTGCRWLSVWKATSTFSSNAMKCFPELSARVRDCNNVRMANRIRMISSSVRPGSFWWEDLT